MANLQKTTAPKSRRQNSCPDGWLNAGAKVPIRLTVRQEEYCRQAVDIHRFCYNLAVRTHRFCRRNRLPLAQLDGHLSKAFNACKREDHPFVLGRSRNRDRRSQRDISDPWYNITGLVRFARKRGAEAHTQRPEQNCSPRPQPPWTCRQHGSPDLP